MNIISSSNSKNIVSLQELVPQHDCLKLLILHTPYILKIDTLHLCINLVKLDLSKNNLESFPYIGDLTNLKFMFLHENKLDINHLKGIFEVEGKKGDLAQHIVWVTFWGNRNQFIARHYLLNETSCIAVDKNLIAPEQKYPFLDHKPSIEPFSFKTDISELLSKKISMNKQATEDEYMRELWNEMSILRKKHQSIFSIIKIQKVFRGWTVRKTIARKRQEKKNLNKILQQFFFEWKLYVDRISKLRYILKQNKKEYLLENVKEIKRKQIELKLIEIAQRIKRKVLSRRINLSYEYTFYNALRRNLMLTKTLYQILQIEKSTSIYVDLRSWPYFQKYVIEFAKKFNHKITEQKSDIGLHYLFEFFSPHAKEMIKILQTNTKSSLYDVKIVECQPKRYKKNRKPILFDQNMKPIYRQIHMSTLEKQKCQRILHSMQNQHHLEVKQLIKISGSVQLLKDLARGVFFYNTKRLTNLEEQNPERINIFSSFQAKKIIAVIKIQRNWRGYIFRKKNGQNIKSFLRFQRATIIVQRWYRRLKSTHKKSFIYQCSKKLSQIQENVFYVQMSEYMDEFQKQELRKKSMKFLEQEVNIYINNSLNQLSLSWNYQSLKHEVLVNLMNKKYIFSKILLSDKLGMKDKQLQNKFIYEIQKFQKCDWTYLFHYKTETAIITKSNRQYLEVECSDRIEAKFRIFCLLLLTYSFRSQKSMQIYSKSSFIKFEQSQRSRIGKDGVTIICNQNITMIKNIEQKVQKIKNVSLHVCNTKIYLNNNQKKPIRLDQKFFIYVLNRKEEKIDENIQIKNESAPLKEMKERKQKYKTSSLGQHYFVTEQSDILEPRESILSQKFIRPARDLKILIKKRSVKAFKIEKKTKKPTPNFILDSISMNDRLTTQPDYPIYPTEGSQRDQNQEQKIHEVSSAQARESSNRQKISYHEKRVESLKRKQLNNFTKKFVNLNNFIQNQYAGEHRRRIKTEIENSAIQSADKIKLSIEKSVQRQRKDKSQKQRKIRQRHTLHRQMMEKNELLAQEHASQLKSQALEERQKRNKQKSKLKKLKVSFAEQCYPLASKSKKGDSFL